MSKRYISHASRADLARRQPGVWTLAGSYDSAESARKTSSHISTGRMLPAYAPMGTFEAYHAATLAGHVVWMRLVDGVEDLVPLALEITPRVLDRGTGPGYEGVTLRTVIVSGLCPQCGGPRGELVGQYACHDGQWLTCDRWDNACGHVDLYADVLAEWRRRPVPVEIRTLREPRPAGDGGRFAEAVALMRMAREKRTITHAKQAAQLVREAGHEEAARLVTEQLAARRGHMSVRQAADYLTVQGSHGVTR